MLKQVLIIALVLFCLDSFAQKNQGDKLVQFSGVVYDVDSNTVVPYVTLTNKTSGKSYSANYKGYYSFITNEGDSILFSSVGYKKLIMVIPHNVSDKRYSAVVRLKSDNIQLPVVRVFPWASTDEFKQEFLTMKIADDDLEVAKKNVKKATLRDFTYELPMSGSEIQQMSFQNQHIGLTNKNMHPTNPLLNPFAWAAFIKQISEGDKSRNK